MPQIPPLSSGEFNQRILIQADTATSADKDKNGAQLEIWEDLATIWAAFEFDRSRPGGAEYFEDPKRRVEDKGTFKVRYYALTAAFSPAANRILFQGKSWNIQRCYDPDGRQREIHIETNSIT